MNSLRSTPVMEGFAVEDDASCALDEDTSGALGVDMLMKYDPLLLLLRLKELQDVIDETLRIGQWLALEKVGQRRVLIPRG